MDFSQPGSLVQEFLCAQDIRVNSKLNYRIGLESFFKWLTDSEIKAPDRAAMLRYKTELLGRQLSSLTINNYLTAIRQFFSWAEAAKGYPNIARNLKGTKPAKGFRKDALTPEQAAKLLAELDTSKIEGLRNYAMLNLMLRTGLRCSEVIWTDIGDLAKIEGQAILWVWGKGCDDKDEFVIVTEASLAPINVYLGARGTYQDRDPIFVSHSHRNCGERLTTQTVRHTAKAAMRAIGIDSLRFSTHSLRHSAITFSLKGGASLQDAQVMARHANIGTTLLYSHNIERLGNSAELKIEEFFPDPNSRHH